MATPQRLRVPTVESVERLASRVNELTYRTEWNDPGKSKKPSRSYPTIDAVAAEDGAAATAITGGYRVTAFDATVYQWDYVSSDTFDMTESTHTVKVLNTFPELIPSGTQLAITRHPKFPNYFRVVVWYCE